MIAYGEHSADAERPCERCERATPHVFRATRIVEPATVGGYGVDLVEAHLVECVVCGARREVEGAAHPDYGTDEVGWVVARRVPTCEAPAWRETVRPGVAFAREAAP